MLMTLLAVAVQVPSPVASEARGTPTARTTERTGSYSPDGSQTCQGRKTSAIRTAATSTIASTTQLMTVP